MTDVDLGTALPLPVPSPEMQARLAQRRSAPAQALTGPGPSTENWVPWVDSKIALDDAHSRLAHADALATESLPPLSDAPQALREATERLAAADEVVQLARASRGFEHLSRPAPTGLAAELARSLREPATARGAIIAGILLGPPKALEE